MSFRVLAVFALTMFLGVALGCADRSDRPATAPVRGTVTYQGAPVAGAAVAFLAPGAPRYAVGTTDEAGRFQLTTFQPNDGAVIGRHVVTVKKFASDEAAAGGADGAGVGKPPEATSIDDAMQEAAKQVLDSRTASSMLPAKYAAERTSDLQVDVVHSANVIELKLVD